MSTETHSSEYKQMNFNSVHNKHHEMESIELYYVYMNMKFKA